MTHFMPDLEPNHIDVLSAGDAYDRAAELYDSWKWQTFWRQTEFPYLVDGFDRLRAVERGTRVLDVGCGTGFFLSECGSHFHEAAGVDVSAKMLSVAHERAPQHSFQQADAVDLPFESQSFNAIICTRVLSHVDRYQRALAEITRVAKPGGLIFLSSVDAAHDYVHTKLPTTTGPVYARTNKYSRAMIEDECAKIGLRKAAGAVILADGSVERDRNPIRRRHLAHSKDDVVGWISILVA